MEIIVSFAEAILFIVVPQAEAWGFFDTTRAPDFSGALASYRL